MNIEQAKVKIQIKDDMKNSVSLCEYFALDRLYEYNDDDEESQGDMQDLVNKLKNLLLAAGAPRELVNKIIIATPNNLAKFKLLEKE